MLDTIQYKASPASKLRVKNPNIIGIIHNIIRFVEADCGVVTGVVDIFCMNQVDTPTRTGIKKGKLF